MASKSIELQVQCPDCKKRQPVQYWLKISADENPELKRQLLNRNLFQYNCGFCGNKFSVRSDLRYLDVPLGLYIYLHPEKPYTVDSDILQMLEFMKSVGTPFHSVYEAHNLDELVRLILEHDRTYRRDNKMNENNSVIDSLKVNKTLESDPKTAGAINFSVMVPFCITDGDKFDQHDTTDEKVTISVQFMNELNTIHQEKDRGIHTIGTHSFELIRSYADLLDGEEYRFTQNLSSQPKHKIEAILGVQLGYLLMKKEAFRKRIQSTL